MIDLSVIIPARNEVWLGRTVADVLEHSGESTEVIVVLDGGWPSEPLTQHPRLHVVYLPESIGQRAATNLGAKLSTAQYICKLDAHCAVAPGWDQELIKAAEELGPHVAQVPAQHNLHVFDWVCACGSRKYQGPTPTECDQCGDPRWQKVVLWRRRRGVRTTAWRFDREMKFQYWGEFTQRPEGQGELTDTLSCIGACWFLERAWFWELGGLDEEHGSWGQMGTEISCKVWLSGGRLVCNQRTWYAHLFRTQGGDFGFPYPLSGSAVERARQYSRALWLDGRWHKATRSLSWLIERFSPVPTWEAPAIKTSKTLTKGLVYYSDCRPDPVILEAVREQLRRVSPGPIVSVTLESLPEFGRNVHLARPRGILTMFQQIRMGLEALDTDIAFLVEHDVLYHASHFAYTPADDVYAYNRHVWKVDASSGRALHYRCDQTSGLVARRDLLLEHYRRRVDAVTEHGFSRGNGFEPGTRSTKRGGFDDVPAVHWMSEAPNIDIRHEHNLTPSRWRKEQFRDQRYTEGWTESDRVPGWGITRGRFWDFLQEVTGAAQQAIA